MTNLRKTKRVYQLFFNSTLGEESEDVEEEEEISEKVDPRWNALKDLKDKK